VFIEYRLYTQTLHNTDHISPGEILQAAGTGGIQLNFRIEITGNLDETGDEAEVSTLSMFINDKVRE